MRRRLFAAAPRAAIDLTLTSTSTTSPRRAPHARRAAASPFGRSRSAAFASPRVAPNAARDNAAAERCFLTATLHRATLHRGCLEPHESRSAAIVSAVTPEHALQTCPITQHLQIIASKTSAPSSLVTVWAMILMWTRALCSPFQTCSLFEKCLLDRKVLALYKVLAF